MVDCDSRRQVPRMMYRMSNQTTRLHQEKKQEKPEGKKKKEREKRRQSDDGETSGKIVSAKNRIKVQMIAR